MNSQQSDTRQTVFYTRETITVSVRRDHSSKEDAPPYHPSPVGRRGDPRDSQSQSQCPKSAGSRYRDRLPARGLGGATRRDTEFPNVCRTLSVLLVPSDATIGLDILLLSTIWVPCSMLFRKLRFPGSTRSPLVMGNVGTDARALECIQGSNSCWHTVEQMYTQHEKQTRGAIQRIWGNGGEKWKLRWISKMKACTSLFFDDSRLSPPPLPEHGGIHHLHPLQPPHGR